MTKSILSIQSHVSYGYVGNRAATFPLQRLGYDVWVINTVQFSNHTGYGEWKGDIFSADHIKDLVEGIEAREVLGNCYAVLSGYMGDASIGHAILEAHQKIKSHHSEALYVCDPVMGDVGRGFFVRPGIFEFVRDYALKQANIITPNQFEAEALTDMKISSMDDAKQVAQKLRAMGPEIVIITSLQIDQTPKDQIQMLMSCSEGEFLISTPFLEMPIAPNGAGDMVSALFLAHYLKDKVAVEAFEKMSAAIYAVFQKTFDAQTRELQLISAQDDLVHPKRTFRALSIQ